MPTLEQGWNIDRHTPRVRRIVHRHVLVMPMHVYFVVVVWRLRMESDWTGRLGGLILIRWVVEVMVGVAIRVC